MSQTVSNQTPARNASGSTPAEVAVQSAATLAATPAVSLVRPKIDTKTIVSLAMLTAIAYIVMLLSKTMPSVMFLDFDFKDVIICIGGFTFGPMTALLLSVMVAFIEMITISDTFLYGFLMNAIATCSFCCTASFIYKKVHSKKGAVIGLASGVVCLVCVMLLWNYLITPLYMTGFSRADDTREPDHTMMIVLRPVTPVRFYLRLCRSWIRCLLRTRLRPPGFPGRPFPAAASAIRLRERM